MPLDERQQALVVGHMAAAEMIARCMRRGDEDVRSVALLALCEAALLYEARRSPDFALFARCHIRNQVIKHLKREKRHEHCKLSADPPSPPQPVDLDRLVSKLPPGDFELFVKFAIKGYTAKAIARRGGFSLRTAYQRISAAVGRVKDALQEVAV